MNLATLIRTRQARGATQSELTLLRSLDGEIARLTAQVEDLLHERDAHTCPRCAHAHQLATQADDPNSTGKDTRAALDKLRAYCKGGK